MRRSLARVVAGIRQTAVRQAGLLVTCALTTAFACVDLDATPPGLPSEERNQESEVNVADVPESTTTTVPSSIADDLLPSNGTSPLVAPGSNASSSSAQVNTRVVSVAKLSDAQSYCRVWLDESMSPLQGEDITVKYASDPAALETAVTLGYKREPMCSAPLLPHNVATSNASEAVTSPVVSAPALSVPTESASAVSSCAATSTSEVVPAATASDGPDASSSATADAGSLSFGSADAGASFSADAGPSLPADAGPDAAPSVPSDLDAAVAVTTLPLAEVLSEGWYFVDDDEALWLELCPNLCASLQTTPGVLLLTAVWGARAPAAR
jgi:hypothetical protein